MTATTSTAYEAERHVSRRCPRMDAHHPADRRVQPLPVPCEDCYSIESVWRRIPYEPDGRTTVTVQQVENGSGQECEGCFGSGSKANVPVHVECPDCGGTGVKNGHAHGKLKHAHAHADEPHAHLLRAICQRPECEPYPTHDIHRGPGYGCDRFGEHP